MVRHLHVPLEDAEFAKLEKWKEALRLHLKRDELSWPDALLSIAGASEGTKG